jgi:hypothetical protein
MSLLLSGLPLIVVITIFGAVLPIYATLGNSIIVLSPATWLIWLGGLAGLTAILLMALQWIGRRAPRARAWLDAVICGVLVAVTLNHMVVFDLLPAPRLDGSEAGFAVAATVALWSVAGFVAVVLLTALLARHGERVRRGLALACLFGAAGTLVPQAMLSQHAVFRSADVVAPDFFQLSGIRNVIHLIPDALQADAVAEVMADRADLRERLRGFQFFVNHVGTHPFTAPALPTLLTGTPHDLTSGAMMSDIAENLRQRSVTSALAQEGVRVHFIGLTRWYCGAGASSCVVADFGGLEAPRPGDDVAREVWNLSLHLDLTLLRLVPAATTRLIYLGSDWLLSGMVREQLGISHVPHPLIEDWVARFTVTPDAPIGYFLYHYIGTHVPFQWDHACTRLPRKTRDRPSLVAQTHCVLEGIARLADRLRDLGVYEQTAIVVSSDHGSGIANRRAGDGVVDAALIAAARATLMVKAPGDSRPFRSSPEPTSLTDVPAILRAFARGEPWSAPPAPRSRRFFWINAADFQRVRRAAIPYQLFEVPEDPSAADRWHLLDISASGLAPAALQKFTVADMLRWQRGSLTGHADLQAAGGIWMARRLDVMISPRSGANALHVRVRPFVKGLSMEARLNHRSVSPPTPLIIEDPNQWWFELIACLSDEDLREGNNQVTLLTSGAFGRALVGDITTATYDHCRMLPQ